MAEASVITRVKIDINPNGISIGFEGLDNDLALLMQSAKNLYLVAHSQ